MHSKNKFLFSLLFLLTIISSGLMIFITVNIFVYFRASTQTINNSEIIKQYVVSSTFSEINTKANQVYQLSRFEKIRNQLEINQQNLNAYFENNQLTSLYSVYFLDLGLSENIPETQYKFAEIEFNSEAEFYPASIYKIPLAMMVLEQADKGNINLDEIVIHEDKPKKISTVIRLMITESNNDSMAILESQLGGYDKSQEKMLIDFGFQVKRRGQITSAKDLGTAFKILIQSDYLSAESKDFLLTQLEDVVPRLRDRIPAAVENFNEENDTNYEALTKIGTLDGVFQDGGIIFDDKNTYILVILNKRRLTYDAVAEIDEITSIVLADLARI